MNVITRFAPSPTGMLHIGSARTALFNYLFAKHYDGKFLLRIEDTDAKRSTVAAKEAIIEGLKWLNINWDEETFYQSERRHRHVELAMQMIKDGTAYYDYSNESEHDGSAPAVRLRIPSGTTIVDDMIHGAVTFNHKDINDLVLLRSDGTPTYMLAVVVDDIDMSVTHIIRGDDHLSNTVKQILIYRTLNAPIPKFAHIPLIHDIEGRKLSKRHNAIAVEHYQDMGYLPEALCNYLMQLGWTPVETTDPSDTNIMSMQDAITKFDIGKVGKSPSRFDFEKLNYINLQYIKRLDNHLLLQHIEPKITHAIGRYINPTEKARILKALDELKKQRTINAVARAALSYLDDFELWTTESAKQLLSQKGDIAEAIIALADKLHDNDADHDFNSAIQTLMTQRQWKMKDVGPVIRSLTIGCTDSVSISKIVEILGMQELVRRIKLLGQIMYPAKLHAE